MDKHNRRRLSSSPLYAASVRRYRPGFPRLDCDYADRNLALIYVRSDPWLS